MNILSLFDGISCARLALDRANIKVNNYYAAEIDKYAIKVSQDNYPDIIRLGDVTNYQAWNLPKIDLVIAGVPCQNFSIAGKRSGNMNLFNITFDIINKYRPEYFLIENVKGLLNINKGETFKLILNKLSSFGYDVNHILINSSLLSAQNRERIYVTNISNVQHPSDKGLVLKDIIDASNSYEEGNKLIRKIFFIPLKIKKCIHMGNANINSLDHTRRVYSTLGKCPTLTTMQGGHTQPKISEDYTYWRKLTPSECEKLQNIPCNYTNIVSVKQRYKCIGNSFTVDVITHILNYIKINK